LLLSSLSALRGGLGRLFAVDISRRTGTVVLIAGLGKLVVNQLRSTSKPNVFSKKRDRNAFGPLAFTIAFGRSLTLNQCNCPGNCVAEKIATLFWQAHATDV
jgi:hypothetical protein